MKITYDPNKNASNIQKHGLSFEDVLNLEWEEAYTWIDDHFDYSEGRVSALVPYGPHLFFVAYHRPLEWKTHYYLPKG